MPLYRVKLGEHVDSGAAERAFVGWLDQLQGEQTQAKEGER